MNHYLQILLRIPQHALTHDQLESSSTAVEQNSKTVLNTALKSLCNLRQGKRGIQKLDKFEKSIKMLIKILDNYLGGYLKIDSKVSTLSDFKTTEEIDG